MRLTPLLNLPAPGRRQTLYVVLDFAESCVFDKQSPGPFHCNRWGLRGRTPTPLCGTPYSEVTVSICRVPSHRFTRAPEDFLLVYLCRISVRFPSGFLRGFSRQRGISGFAAVRPPHRFSASVLHQENGFACPPRLRAWPSTSNGRDRLASCVTPSVFVTRREVQEC